MLRSNEEEDGPPGSGALARVEDGLENGGDDKGNGIDSDQLLEFAEKIPNIEMLLSKVIQVSRSWPIPRLRLAMGRADGTNGACRERSG